MEKYIYDVIISRKTGILEIGKTFVIAISRSKRFYLISSQGFSYPHFKKYIPIKSAHTSLLSALKHCQEKTRIEILRLKNENGETKEISNLKRGLKSLKYRIKTDNINV